MVDSAIYSFHSVMEIYGKQKKIFANTLYPSSQSVPICVKKFQKYLHLHFILRVVDKSIDAFCLFHQKTFFSMDAISCCLDRRDNPAGKD